MKPNQIEFSRTQDKQQVTSLETSIRDYRNTFPQLTNQQIAKRYQMRYGIGAKKVLSIMDRMNNPTGGDGAA